MMVTQLTFLKSSGELPLSVSTSSTSDSLSPSHVVFAKKKKNQILKRVLLLVFAAHVPGTWYFIKNLLNE